MRKTLAVVLLTILFFGCKSEIKQNNINLADFNLILKTNEDIDSVLVMDIGQNREYHKVVFEDTIKINFNDSINDLYNIWFLKDGKMISSPTSNQVWLNGKNIIIVGSIEKKLVVDTIIGSDLNYKSRKDRESLGELLEKKSDANTVNDFLLKSIEENFDNPYSLTQAKDFVLRNQDNKTNLKNLQKILLQQNELIKNHGYFSIYEELDKKISTSNKINLNDYEFYNLNNESVGFEFDKNQKYILDFWFVNCPPCVRDHKEISKKLDLFKKNKIELVGISIDETHTAWANYIDSNNYNWLNFREINNSKTISEDFAISSYPTYILIENGGEIKTTFISFKDLEDYLKNK